MRYEFRARPQVRGFLPVRFGARGLWSAQGTVRILDVSSRMSTPGPKHPDRPRQGSRIGLPSCSGLRQGNSTLRGVQLRPSSPRAANTPVCRYRNQGESEGGNRARDGLPDCALPDCAHFVTFVGACATGIPERYSLPALTGGFARNRYPNARTVSRCRGCFGLSSI